MYWGQVSAALAAAIGVAYWLSRRGEPTAVAVLSGIVAYILARWLFAWFFRTRYWINHDDYNSQSCPSCGQYIYRTSGDWVLSCHRCGWTAGWPIVRWVTHSVPVHQLRRTVVGSRLLIVVLLSALVATGAAASISINDIQTTPSESTDSTDAPTTVEQTPTATRTENDIQSINNTRIERLIFKYVNSKRERRDMSDFTYNRRAAHAAERHAEEMAKYDYFSHTNRSGETQSQRYAFCEGGENAAQTWLDRRIEQSDGSIVEFETMEGLARGIVEQWMNSRPHRERGIYGEWWRSAGVGVAISDDDKVYAVMGFCSK